MSLDNIANEEFNNLIEERGQAFLLDYIANAPKDEDYKRRLKEYMDYYPFNLTFYKATGKIDYESLIEGFGAEDFAKTFMPLIIYAAKDRKFEMPPWFQELKNGIKSIIYRVITNMLFEAFENRFDEVIKTFPGRMELFKDFVLPYIDDIVFFFDDETGEFQGEIENLTKVSKDAPQEVFEENSILVPISIGRLHDMADYIRKYLDVIYSEDLYHACAISVKKQIHYKCIHYILDSVLYFYDEYNNMVRNTTEDGKVNDTHYLVFMSHQYGDIDNLSDLTEEVLSYMNIEENTF